MSAALPRGPYGSWRAAAADAEAFHGRAREGGEDDMGRARVRLLLDTLAGFGVRAGSFDQFVLAGIGQWEPLGSVVLATLFARVYAAGLAAGTEAAK